MEGFGSANQYENSLEITAYAPADFPDAEVTRPAESYLDSGSQSPATIYSSTIHNTLQRHTREIRERTLFPSNYQNSWKKKIRDIFLKGNDGVLGFLSRPLSANPTLGSTEQLIRRFSRSEQPQGNNNQILRDLVADISGYDVYDLINQRLDSKKKSTAFHSLVEQVHELYELYREVMEEIVAKDYVLRQKVNMLDKIQPRLVMLLDLGVNETTEELQKNIESYLEKIYKDNNPENEYKELLVLYKKIFVIREAIQLLRLSASPDKEPICGICLTDTVTYALVPCGHTYCENCSKKQMMSCYMCRQHSTQRVKLFFT